MTYTVARYQPQDAAAWDAFVRDSRNGTFLLQRGFMDYHSDRFDDLSLLLRDGDGRLAGILPAHRCGDVVHSHQGLTYGGLLIGDRPGAADVLAMLEAIARYLAALGVARLGYKTIPAIYHRQPAEDDRYALFRLGAVLSRRDVLSVVPSGPRLAYQQRRARGVRGAQRAGVEVRASGDFPAFWAILEAVLQDRHGAVPTHSLAEIELLQSRFPEQIRLFGAFADGAMQAGAVIFETPRVAHVQYIAASARGRELSALDALFDALLNQVYPRTPYFDFGISNEAGGRVLNRGLVEQKEGFGARTMVHDHYMLELGTIDAG